MRRHFALSVSGALKNCSFEGFTDEFGRALSASDVKAELERLHADGVKLLPMGGCDNFDPETGCRGHETPKGAPAP